MIARVSWPAAGRFLTSRMVVALLLASVALLCSSPRSQARDAPAQTTPGRYQEWGPDIDEIEIARSFRVADYERIAVETLATDAVALPPTDENTYEPVRNTLARFSDIFADGVHATSPKPVQARSVQDASSVGVLGIRGQVVVLDPGSRAKRYWGGFGAGAVRVEVHCELVDAATGEVLLSFTQQRRAGFGAFGGGYEELMARTIRQVGSDAGNILRQF